MAVRLRLALVGKKHAPVFRIVAIDSRKMRDGRYLDNLGTYNPVTGEYVQFHVDRIDEWLKKGAVPSDSVKKLYKKFKQDSLASKQGTPSLKEVEVAEMVAEAADLAETPKEKATPKKEEASAAVEEVSEKEAK